MTKLFARIIWVIIVLGLIAASVEAQTNTFPSSGNVGIGTTTPSQELSVSSGSLNFDNFGFASSYRGSLNNYTNLFLGGALVDNGNGTYQVETDGGSNYFAAIRMDNGSTNLGTINFYTGPNTGTTSYTLTNAQLANYLRMTINNGEVGIGTANANGHMLMVRDAANNGIDWSMEVNNPINMQGSSLPAEGIKLSLSTEESGGNESDKWIGLLAYTEPGAEYGNSMGLAIYTNQGAGLGQAPTEKMRITATGNVGIGTTSPSQTLEVNGTAQIDNGLYFPGSSTPQTTPWTGVLCGGDYAESMDVTGSRTNYGPGDLLVLDTDHAGKVLKSIEPYSTVVSGIYATKPGVVGRRQLTPASDSEVPMAMVGVVPTKVSAENGPIHVGDLLVSSSTPGHAMKGTDRTRMFGAVIGKAMGDLDSGTGEIEVLVTLQ